MDTLRAAGHDVIWARTDCAGWKDTALLDMAEADARILLTLDKDFWQIALQRRTPLERSGVLWFRVHPSTPDRLAPLLRAFEMAGKGWAGNVSIITTDGIQIFGSRKR